MAGPHPRTILLEARADSELHLGQLTKYRFYSLSILALRLAHAYIMWGGVLRTLAPKP